MSSVSNNDENKYIYFDAFNIGSGEVSQGFDLFNDNSDDNSYLMKYEDFIDLIKKFSDSYVINYSRIIFEIITIRNKKITPSEIDGEYHGYKLYDAGWKYGDDVYGGDRTFHLDHILNDTTFKIIKDAYDRHLLDMMFIKAKKETEIFLNSQTSYDNVDKYKNMLEAIKNNE